MKKESTKTLHLVSVFFGILRTIYAVDWKKLTCILCREMFDTVFVLQVAGLDLNAGARRGGFAGSKQISLSSVYSVIWL